MLAAEELLVAGMRLRHRVRGRAISGREQCAGLLCLSYLPWHFLSQRALEARGDRAVHTIGLAVASQ